MSFRLTALLGITRFRVPVHQGIGLRTHVGSIRVGLLGASWGHLERPRADWVSSKYLGDFHVVAGGFRQPLGPPGPKTQNLDDPTPTVGDLCAAGRHEEGKGC